MSSPGNANTNLRASEANVFWSVMQGTVWNGPVKQDLLTPAASA